MPLKTYVVTEFFDCSKTRPTTQHLVANNTPTLLLVWTGLNACPQY